MEAQCLEPPERGYLAGVRELCDRYGALLVFDEVVTGFRWALGGAQERFGVMPDLTCLGKAIANGMPLSAIGGRRKFMNELDHVFFSMTFGGECLSLAAAIATIDILKTKDYEQIWNLGDIFDQWMNEAAEANGLSIEFEGSAPRHKLSFSDDYADPGGMKDLFFQEMVKQGILFSNVLYVTFAHNIEDMAKIAMAADRAFAFVKKNIGDIDSALEGRRSIKIFERNKH